MMNHLLVICPINNWSSGISQNSHFEVQDHDFGIYLFIICLLIFVFFKSKKQSFEDYEKSNTSSKSTTELNYLNYDVLLQPKQLFHQEETSLFSKPWSIRFTPLHFLILFIIFTFVAIAAQEVL